MWTSFSLVEQGRMPNAVKVETIVLTAPNSLLHVVKWNLVPLQLIFVLFLLFTDTNNSSSS